jgi:Flp pilus assembly protein TadD
VLATSGRIPEAIAELRTLLVLDPAWPPAANNLAWLLATCEDVTLRDGAEAVRLAEIARRPTISSTLGTLAAAYAQAGRFDDAVRAIDEAIALESQKPGSPELKNLERMKAAFGAKQAYTDTELGKGAGR